MTKKQETDNVEKQLPVNLKKRGDNYVTDNDAITGSNPPLNTPIHLALSYPLPAFREVCKHFKDYMNWGNLYGRTPLMAVFLSKTVGGFTPIPASSDTSEVITFEHCGAVLTLERTKEIEFATQSKELTKEEILDRVKCMIEEFEAKPNIQNLEGLSALEMAVSTLHHAAAQYLLDNGADPELRGVQKALQFVNDTDMNNLFHKHNVLSYAHGVSKLIGQAKDKLSVLCPFWASPETETESPDKSATPESGSSTPRG